MTLNPTVLAVVATALILVLGNYAKNWLSQERTRRAQALKAQAELTAALIAFNLSGAEIAKAMEGIKDLPKFMDGFVKVCQAFVMEVGKMRKSADQLAKLILQGQDGKEALQVPTENEKDIAYRVMEKMAAGADLETAQQDIADEELKKTGYGLADL